MPHHLWTIGTVVILCILQVAADTDGGVPPIGVRSKNPNTDVYCRKHVDRGGSDCQVAIFAGGSFLDLKKVYDERGTEKGVLKTIIGYTGGFKKNPNYQEVCTGSTGHSEAVMVLYDPSIVKYEDLVVDFFDHHSPLFQQKDLEMLSMQHRSIIYYVTKQQNNKAKEVRRKRSEQETEKRGSKEDGEEKGEKKEKEGEEEGEKKTTAPLKSASAYTELVAWDGSFYEETKTSAQLASIKERVRDRKSEKLQELKDRLTKGESLQEVMNEMYKHEITRRKEAAQLRKIERKEKDAEDGGSKTVEKDDPDKGSKKSTTEEEVKKEEKEVKKEEKEVKKGEKEVKKEEKEVKKEEKEVKKGEKKKEEKEEKKEEKKKEEKEEKAEESKKEKKEEEKE